MKISLRSFGRHRRPTTPPNNVTKILDSHIYAQYKPNIYAYLDLNKRIPAGNCDLTNLVRSVQVINDFLKTVPPQDEVESGGFHPLERQKILPGGRDRLSQSAEVEMLKRGASVWELSLLPDRLGRRKSWGEVDLVKRAVELVRPESPA